MTLKSRFAPIIRSSPFRYGLSVLLTLVTVLMCHIREGFAPEPVAYILLSTVIVFSAWSFGAGPAAVSAGLVIGTEYWLTTLRQRLQMPDTPHLLILLAFVFASAVIITMTETRRRQHQELRKEQAELEERVKQRTAQLDTANRSLRDLSARLLQMQDEERRRIARELHDSVGQLLAALGMNISSARAEIERLTKAATVLSDSEGLIQEMSREVRTISHLLHPPLLDEAGLASAVRWYIDGFVQRSQIKVNLDWPENFERLPRELETAMFRVIQESLTNIHRHSGSQIASVRGRHIDGEVLIEIADHGKGIAPEKLAVMKSGNTPGVGIRGMRERLRQLGGDLEILSDLKGTVVKARVPLAEQFPLAHSTNLDASKAAA